MSDDATSQPLRRAYEAWVRDHATALYRCAVRLSGRRDVAEELVQEAFYHGWRSIKSLKEPGKARGWLLRILRHRYAHWVRDQRRHPATAWDDAAGADSVEADEPAPHESLARRESLQAALDALESRYKEPFLLVFLEGMTCEEAGREMKLPLGTVLSRIHRARAFLREHLDPGRAKPGRAAARAPRRRERPGGPARGPDDLAGDLGGVAGAGELGPGGAGPFGAE